MQHRERARGRPVWSLEGDEEARRAVGSWRKRRHCACVWQTSENREKDAAAEASLVSSSDRERQEGEPRRLSVASTR